MGRFLLVCLGGAVGTGARYVIGMISLRLVGPNWPAGTLAVNVAGCFLMGLMSAWARVAPAVMSETARVAITAGFLGGLTTYSAFNQESLRLLVERPGVGLGYVLATIFGCAGAGALGLWVAR